MATGIASPDSGRSPKPPAGKGQGKVVDYGQFIDGQLRRTRGQVKATEIAMGLMSLLVAALAFLLVAILVDHWLIHGGLGVAHRVVLFSVLVIGAVYYLATTVVPALVKRVNPVYAAHTIERSKPSLKNSLINFLLLRQHPEAVPQVVYSALAKQAATGLSKTHVDSAVDRTRLIRMGYVLIAFVAAFTIYAIFSPKDPLTSAERVILPWADLPAPSRVSIRDIKPGSGNAFRGQPVEVSAEVQGLGSDDDVKILYTTADHQVDNQVIVMHVPTGAYWHVAALPESKDGLQQDVSYRIEAGDAVSRTYHIHSIPAPTIVVDRVDYKYPPYTGLDPVTVEHRGDLKALEGTEVTLHAKANQPIKSAIIDFNCDNQPDAKLKIDGQEATITFKLSLNETRTAPQFKDYRLLMKNDQNLDNPQPIKHQIEVVPDLPPEVAVLTPQQEEVVVPSDGQLMIEVRATDPDFALADLKLRAKTERGSLFDQSLLHDAPHTGPFVGKYQFVPAQLGLKEGDVVRYLAQATDNKAPQANETSTSPQRIRVGPPENVNPKKQQNQNPARNNDQPQDPSKQPQNPNDARNNDQPQPDRPNRNSSTNKDRQNDPQPPDDQRDRTPRDQDNRQRSNSADQPPEQNKRDQNQPENPDRKPGAKDKQQNQDKQDEGKQNSEDEQKQGEKNKDQNKPDQRQSNDKNQKGGQGGDSSSKDSGGKGSQPKGSEKSGDKQQNGDQNQSSDGQGQSSNNQGQSPNQQKSKDKKQSDGQNQKGESGQSGSPKDSQRDNLPVPSDGSDDGRGVERLLEHQKDQQNQSPGNQSKDGQSKQNPQPGDRSQENSKQQPGGNQQPGDNRKTGENPGASAQKPDGGSESKQAGDKSKGQLGQPQADKHQTGNDGQSGTPQQDGAQAGEKSKQPGQGQSADKNSPSTAGQSPDKNAMSDNDKQSGKSGQPGAKAQGQDRDPGNQPKKPSDALSEPDKNQTKSNEGAGAQANDGSLPDKEKDKNGEKKSQDGKQGDEKAQGGDPDTPKGNAGAGQGDKDPHGAPSPQKPSKPTDKSPDGDKKSEPADRKGDAYPASNGTHESKTKGEEGGNSADTSTKPEPGQVQQSDSPGGGGGQGKASAQQGAGDQEGGGGKGGGQKADKPGTGAAGDKTAADQGRGAASEPGKGETSNQAGADQKSDSKTGRSGNEKGNGSMSRQSDNPNPSAAQPSDDQKEKPNDQKSSDQSPTDQNQPHSDQQSGQSARSNDSKSKSPENGSNQGKGPATNGKSQGAPKEGKGNSQGGEATAAGDDLPEGPATKPDDPNLNYAKQATELALDYLKNAMKDGKQRDEVLKDLGWTRDEAEKFIDRQEQRLKNAQRANPEDPSRRQAEDALRSLGLRPSRTDRAGGNVTADSQRGMSSGRRTAPPPEYADQYKAYSQGLNSQGGR